MSIINNMPNSGMKINGLIEEYYVAAGETVNAGDFVEFGQGIGNVGVEYKMNQQFFSSKYHFSGKKINNNLFFLTNSNAEGSVSCYLVKRTSSNSLSSVQSYNIFVTSGTWTTYNHHSFVVDDKIIFCSEVYNSTGNSTVLDIFTFTETSLNYVGRFTHDSYEVGVQILYWEGGLKYVCTYCGPYADKVMRIYDLTFNEENKPVFSNGITTTVNFGAGYSWYVGNNQWILGAQGSNSTAMILEFGDTFTYTFIGSNTGAATGSWMATGALTFNSKTHSIIKSTTSAVYFLHIDLVNKIGVTETKSDITTATTLTYTRGTNLSNGYSLFVTKPEYIIMIDTNNNVYPVSGHTISNSGYYESWMFEPLEDNMVILMCYYNSGFYYSIWLPTIYETQVASTLTSPADGIAKSAGTGGDSSVHNDKIEVYVPGVKE